MQTRTLRRILTAPVHSRFTWRRVSGVGFLRLLAHPDCIFSENQRAKNELRRRRKVERQNRKAGRCRRT